MQRSEVRIHNIRQFTECSRFAIASMGREWDGRVHVSSWIGATVRSRLQGVETEGPPDDLIFDKTTRNGERASETVDKILGGIAEFDAKYEPEYMEREMYLRGVYESTSMAARIDALAAIGESIVLLDISMGRKPPAVWIQTALSAWVLNRDRGLEVDAVGSLHVPRLGPRTEQRWTYEQRPFEAFKHDVAQWLWTLDKVRHANWDELAASPGQHCDRCPVEDCAIRANPLKDS